MLVISDKRVYIEHVMWQPTGWCMKRCTGCYVKAYQKEAQVREDTFGHDWARWNTKVAEELVYLLESEQLVCDQFTVALDDIDPGLQTRQTLARIWRLAALKPGWLCVTACSLEDIFKYLPTGTTVADFLRPVSMASFSVCPTPQQISEYNLEDKVNLQARDMGWKPNIVPEDADVSHVYVLLTKPALGDEVDPKNIKDFLETLKRLEGTPNVTPDVCMTDSVKYLKEGLHCGAGINKIAVWPYGHVTGCPYDVHITRKPEAKLMDEILKVVRGEKDSILRCGIPQALKEYKCPTKQQT